MANPVTTLACPICLENFYKMKRVIITLECSHVYCRKCLRSYVLEQLRNGANVRCPDPTCASYLDLKGALKGLVSQKLIKEAQKKTKFNGCPVSRCNGTLKDGQCDRCHTKLCSQCGEIEHPNKECNPDIKASYQQILYDSKSCPDCHVKIYKDGGCNHVHCNKCNKDFDWITMRPWDVVLQEMIALADQDTHVFNNQPINNEHQNNNEQQGNRDQSTNNDHQNVDENIHPLDIVGQHNQIRNVWSNIIREMTDIDTMLIRHLHDSEQFNEDTVIG